MRNLAGCRRRSRASIRGTDCLIAAIGTLGYFSIAYRDFFYNLELDDTNLTDHNFRRL